MHYNKLLLTLGLSLSFTAAAQPSEPLLAKGLAQCAVIQDKLDRLICYDQLALADKPSDVQQHAQVAQVVDMLKTTEEVTQTVKAKNVQSFGLQAKVPAEEVDDLLFTVAEVSYNPYGEMKLTFDNGQVWRQLEAKRYRLKVGDQVRIARASLGSFLLNKVDRNASIRVKRVQ